MKIDRLSQISKRLDEACVLIIGDIMLDRYIRGSVTRISPEAPVPIVEVTSESLQPGGAANVASNITAFDGKAIIIGVVGNDSHGEKLMSLLNERKVTIGYVARDKERLTTVKMRIIAEHQQAIRADWEDKRSCKEHSAEFIDAVGRYVKKAKAIVISDYDKGVITSEFLSGVIPLAKQYKKPIVVDPKIVHFHEYRGVTIVTPNLKEASAATGIGGEDDVSVVRMGRKILADLNCNAALITRGKAGMTLIESGGNVCHIPAHTAEVYDVTGAGDTVTAVVASVLAIGGSLLEATVLANVFAGIVVRKLGTANVSKQEIESELKELSKRNYVKNIKC